MLIQYYAIHFLEYKLQEYYNGRKCFIFHENSIMLLCRSYINFVVLLFLHFVHKFYYLCFIMKEVILLIVAATYSRCNLP